MKQIVIALVDRLAAHAAREAENNDEDEASEPVASPKATSVKAADDEAEEKPEGEENAEGTVVNSEENEDVKVHTEEEEETAEEEQELAPIPKAPKVRKIRGIPEDVKLFEIFWGKIVELVKVRNILSCDKTISLFIVAFRILTPETSRYI